MDTIKTDGEYIANTYARFPISLVSGKGSVLEDENGKKYIDFGTGIAVNSFGIADEEWKEAVTAQLSALQHTSNLYYASPCAKLAKMLCERTGMKKVFFSNSGAEANECAIKAARRWSLINKGEGFSTIITLKNSFHGRTITTLSATGQDNFHTDFMPFTPGFVYGSATDSKEILNLAEENKCAAVMMELVQGEGGVYPLSKNYVNEVLEIAKEKNLLVIIDEVQTGNGRTGSLYSFMNYNFTPDIFTTAKGLAGGLPIGATVLGEKVKDVFTPGTHGSTFGGNPVCCAGACSILSRIDDECLCGVREKSEYIFKELEGAKGVKSVSGMGLMIGIETEKNVKDVISKCMENGLLVLSAKNKVRLLPALNIPWDIMVKGVDILKGAIGE